MTTLLNDELIELLIKKASTRCWNDDEDSTIEDYCGGNYDDAYEGGINSGEILQSRFILNKLGIGYTIE